MAVKDWERELADWLAPFLEARRAPKPKTDMALDEIDRLRAAGVRFGCVLADAGYGISAAAAEVELEFSEDRRRTRQSRCDLADRPACERFVVGLRIPLTFRS